MTPSPTPFVGTSTVPATVTTAALETARPSSPPTTLAPVDGITSTQVNVRAEPSTAGNVLGIIPADMRVEITGRDPAGNWWQINYPHPEAIDGKGWVTAQYVTMPATVDVPVVGDPGTGPNRGAVAVIQQQLNVRSGPGTDFNPLGTLNPQDVVSLTGKDPNGGWLQIDFAAGPEGKGWVNAAFVQAQGVEDLPIVAESGVVVGTGTPTSVPPTPTPTLVPAQEDHDSASSPIASVVFEATGTQTFIYNGELSAPQGDRADWIAFRPYDRVVFASLECRGSDGVNVQLLENNFPMDTYIKCGSQMEQLAVKAGATYVLHVEAVGSGEILQYTNYILTIKSRP
jgi:uncharacterized protein YraI